MKAFGTGRTVERLSCVPVPVPARILLEHGCRTPAEVVDVVDLPGGVVQEVHGRLLHQDVVVVGAAPHERRDGGHLVTDLEAGLGGDRRAVASTATPFSRISAFLNSLR